MKELTKVILINKFLLKTGITLLFAFCSLFLKAQDFSKIYDQVNPTVVTIKTTETVVTDGNIGESGGLGTGVIIDKEGLIITAAHVVESAEEIVIKTHDGQVFFAEVVSSIASADIALLKMRNVPKNISVATLGNSDSVKIGEQIIVIGTPYGLEHSLSVGHISGKQKRGVILAGLEMEFLQTDAAINQGNSGGPIFNTKGAVIGIVSSILTQSGGFDGIGFAASITPSKKILLERSPFWIGFEGVFIQNEIAAAFNIPSGAGVLIQRVVSGSIADKANLRGGSFKANIFGRDLWIGGDIILSIQNIVCDKPHNLNSIKGQINTLTPGGAIVMEVLRGGKIITLSMVL